jgi:acetoin:2,6-dichlorophenolindophenol oxidoreductase subunit alpha
MATEIKMPDLSTTGDEVLLVRWLVQVGETVALGQPLFEIETDKATMEVESVAAGVLQAQGAAAGDVVAVGQVVAVIDKPSPPTPPLPRHGEGSQSQLVESVSVMPSTPVIQPQSTTPPSSSTDRMTPPLYEVERGKGGEVSPAKPPHAAPSYSPSLYTERAVGGEMSLFARNKARRAANSATADLLRPISEDEAARYSTDLLLDLYERMVLIRQFEERVKLLFLEGSMPGTIHQAQGQEACAVGVCAALNADDLITSTHRPHGHALAKGLTPDEMMIELFGKGTGSCKGKGGSMHIGNMQRGMVPAIAIVGGGIPLAAGMGLAIKMQGMTQVVACFFGEGATQEGAFHEGVNLAAIWSLPVIFICENNLYGASTNIRKVTRTPRVSERAAAYGIRGETVDGNNVLAVYEATRRAADECRRGAGPVLLELLTYRRTGHSRRDPNHYQPKDEQEFWYGRDPITMLRNVLADELESELLAREAAVNARIETAVEVARAAPEPTPDDLLTDVYATPLM